MKKHVIAAAAVLATGIGAAGITAALAESNDGAKDHEETTALMDARLSVADAMQAAISVQPGKVAEVQFNLDKGVASYEVSIVAADGTEHGFTVDANTGKLEKLAANEDHSGADYDGDENGENEEGDSD